MRSALVIVMVASTSCSRVQRVPLMTKTVTLPDGRFTGPLEIPTPRHADHDGQHFEVLVRVESACDPLFTLAFPDGEQQDLGVRDDAWQALLTARAQGEVWVATPGALPGSPTPIAPPAAPAPASPAPSEFQPAPFSSQQPSPPPVGPVAGAGVDATLDVPPLVVGSWRRTQTEQWAGQLAFEAQRTRRCGAVRTFTARYRSAFDETNTVALWAKVPQELAGATLTVELVKLVTPKKAIVENTPTTVAVTPRVRPPRPEPRQERPAAAKADGARWIPGQWVWREGDGEWVWSGGSWSPPPRAPAPRVENPGPPPVPGCRWAAGRWSWVGTDGSWEWVPGSWKAPPPLDEPRLDPPDPTAPWIQGYWVSTSGTFRWQPGRWGQPPPRAETPPPPPRPGAQWISGEWLLVSGKYVWSPGFYAGTEQPPPPKVEAIPPRPHPDAVWLSGFWRWDVTVRVHVWISGRWELPPGEDYVWVEEKVAPGLMLRGRWELRVRP
jgi:hypothetical protein